MFATWERNVARLSEGHKLLFFVSGTRSFRGVFQAVGRWSKVASPRYPDEVLENRIIYPFEIKIEPIALGVADLDKIKPALSFIEHKDKWGIYVQTTPGNHGNPISDEDYHLILQEIQRNPETEVSISIGGTSLARSSAQAQTKVWLESSEESPHNRLINKLMTIGEVFGFETVREPSVNDVRPQDKPFSSKGKELDVGWKMALGAWVPIEVQVHGSVPDLMYRLHLVHQWSHRMIVVAEPRIHDELREAAKIYPFQDKLILLQPDEILKGSESLHELKNLRTKIFQ